MPADDSTARARAPRRPEDRTARASGRAGDGAAPSADPADAGAEPPTGPGAGAEPPTGPGTGAATGSADPADSSGPADSASPADSADPVVPADPAGPADPADPVDAPGVTGPEPRATRRFPLFTRDTARPEGGGRAAPGHAPAPARQWPMLAVAGLAAFGLLLTALGVFRFGTLLVGAALLTGAALRWVVPDVGMLAIRSRFTDVITCTMLGMAIVLLALMAQPKPLLEIPFLNDTLRYTISQ